LIEINGFSVDDEVVLVQSVEQDGLDLEGQNSHEYCRSSEWF